jgi:hypothetical protein
MSFSEMKNNIRVGIAMTSIRIIKGGMRQALRQ